VRRWFCGAATTGHKLMRYCLLTAIVATVLIAFGCERPKTPAKHGPAPAAEPLLLGDDPEPTPLETAGADNSRCHVCHINYAQESIAVTHAGANIGCKDCHGESDAHIADESWASGGTGTPPEIMYPRAKVNGACMSCHKPENINTAEHKPLFDPAQDKVCTDCHGSHGLTRRKVRWK